MRNCAIKALGSYNLQEALKTHFRCFFPKGAEIQNLPKVFSPLLGTSAVESLLLVLPCCLLCMLPRGCTLPSMRCLHKEEGMWWTQCHPSAAVLLWWADIPAGTHGTRPAASVSPADADDSVVISYLQASDRLETQMEIKARQKDSRILLLVQPGAWKS